MSFYDVILNLSERIFWSMWVSVGFAMMFSTPKRAMWIVGLLAATGWTIKNLLLIFFFPEQIVLASFIAASIIGFLGMYFAHRVHTPPVVFTIPAVINMVPGKYGYEFMMGIIKMVTSVNSDSTAEIELVLKTLKLGLQTGFITMSLAFGVIAPMLLLNTYSVKGKDLNQFILKRIKRKKKKVQQEEETI